MRGDGLRVLVALLHIVNHFLFGSSRTDDNWAWDTIFIIIDFELIARYLRERRGPYIVAIVSISLSLRLYSYLYVFVWLNRIRVFKNAALDSFFEA